MVHHGGSMVHHGVGTSQQRIERARHTSSAVTEQRDDRWCSTRFLLFILSKIPASRMELPTFRVGLPISITQASETLSRACLETCLIGD